MSVVSMTPDVTILDPLVFAAQTPTPIAATPQASIAPILFIAAACAAVYYWREPLLRKMQGFTLPKAV